MCMDKDYQTVNLLDMLDKLSTIVRLRPSSSSWRWNDRKCMSRIWQSIRHKSKSFRTHLILPRAFMSEFTGLSVLVMACTDM